MLSMGLDLRKCFEYSIGKSQKASGGFRSFFRHSSSDLIRIAELSK
jgi:hypothetical protein